eukprot:UN33436
MEKHLRIVFKFAQIFYQTTHGAKGMEYENVRLLNDFINYDKLMEESTKTDIIYPFKNAGCKYLREEINLLYVAVTRAQKNLFMNETVEKIKADIFSTTIEEIKKQ